MAITAFPDVDQADEDGLLAIGGDLEIPSLKLAYSNGIFPWPVSHTSPLAWFAPDPRGILEFRDFHIPRRLTRELKKTNYRVSFNEDFGAVILGCANSKTRKGQTDTWITNKIVQSYIDFHHAGNAYSVEVWDKDELVGGLYGVNIGRMVTGESMFFTKDNASKLALISIVEHLQSKGIEWLDTQMVTPIVESMGGKEISRDKFMGMLKASLIAPPNFKLFD